MKHSELVAELAGYLTLLRQDVSPEQLELLARHLELVIEANRRVNLTRVTSPADAVRLHTADSLTVLAEVGGAPAGPLLDLGSGAGFPGIPLAVCSSRQVVLLDSVGKKVRELRLMVDALGLSGQVKATDARAEAMALDRPGEFAVVTVRAVSELPALVELASPLLMHRGLLVCLKGSPSALEITRAAKVAKRVGMRLESDRRFDLPEHAGHRTVLCYRRQGTASIALPRREGLAQHSPLA